jgi:hypothetical protein
MDSNIYIRCLIEIIYMLWLDRIDGCNNGPEFLRLTGL